MKNFLKNKRAKKTESADALARITNETVAEHREKVLAGGRKFKYPLQYQKHKLVVNSVIIGVAAVVLLTIFGWQQLYVGQNSSKLAYRVTQLVPVMVASVDGEGVRYSEYLMRYRSSIYYIQKQDSVDLHSEDGRRQMNYFQRKELTSAEKAAFVSKLARTKNLTVTDQEVTRFIEQDINDRSVSLNAYEKTVLNSYYDWSLDEYKGIVRGELLRRKVAFAVDGAAQQRANDILSRIRAGADFSVIAKAESADIATKENGGDSGVLPVTNLDQSGLIAAAQKLEPNQISDLIQGIDGYYIVQLTSKDKDTIRFRQIKVTLTALDQQFADLQKNGKIKEYITVKQ